MLQVKICFNMNEMKAGFKYLRLWMSPCSVETQEHTHKTRKCLINDEHTLHNAEDKSGVETLLIALFSIVYLKGRYCEKHENEVWVVRMVEGPSCAVLHISFWLMNMVQAVLKQLPVPFEFCNIMLKGSLQPWLSSKSSPLSKKHRVGGLCAVPVCIYICLKHLF